ncbi:MAG: DUF2723 domain-containing protein [Candidatus Ozemobacteraceae bacterium]
MNERNNIPRYPWPLFFTVVALGLLLYIPSLQPGIGWYNAGEFSAAAITLDVPHSPGYPLFTRLANLAVNYGPSIVSGKSPAWYVNFVAAAAAATGAGVFALWLHSSGLSPLLAGAAAFWMLTFGTFWEEATLGEIYTLEILLLNLFFLSVWRVMREPPGFWGAALPGFLYALGLGHRPTFGPLTLVALIFFLATILRSPRPFHAIAGGLCGFLTGLLPTLDLYMRLQNSHRVLTDPLTGLGLAGLWHVFSAAEFRGGLGVFSFSEVVARASDWAVLLISDGGPAALLLPLLAFRRPEPASEQTSESASRQAFNPQVYVLGWMLGFNSLFIINYNAFEAQTMLLPSMMALAGLAAHGLHTLRGMHGRRLAAWALAVVAAVSALVSAHRIEPRDRSAEQWAYRMAAMIPADSSLLVSNDVEFRPFWYLRLARRFRPKLKLRLIDKIDEAGLKEIGADLSRTTVAGSLIYPVDLREKLQSRFDLLSLGYLTIIQPTGTPLLDMSLPENALCMSLSMNSSSTFAPYRTASEQQISSSTFATNRIPSELHTFSASFTPPIGSEPRLLFTPNVTVAPMPDENGRIIPRKPPQTANFSDKIPPGERNSSDGTDFSVASGTLIPGDVLFYRYSLEQCGSAVTDIVLGAILISTTDGKPFTRNGVLLGHDLHPALDGVCPLGKRASEAPDHLENLRVLIVPEGIETGTYDVRLVVARLSPSAWKNLQIHAPVGFNLLNGEGAAEVFRLRNGVAGRPLLRAIPDWESLSTIMKVFPRVSEAPLLGRFFVTSPGG